MGRWWVMVWAVACGPVAGGPGGVSGSTVLGPTGSGGPGSSPSPGTNTVPVTASGIQIGEGGDDLPCTWEVVDDPEAVAEAEAQLQGVWGVHEGVITRPSERTEPLVLQVDPGPAQAQRQVPLFTGYGTADTGATTMCGLRRVAFEGAASLQGEGWAVQGTADLVVFDTAVSLSLLASPSEASPLEPQLLHEAYDLPHELAFRADPLVGTGVLAWEAVDGTTTYSEVVGWWEVGP
jgi:hypothetical protein